MSNNHLNNTVLDLVRLGQLFSETYRVTLNIDGKTFESDTDHTVTLSLVATYIATKYYPNLNIGQINNLCLVHDLVEAYAGDTDTFMMNFTPGTSIQNDKKNREHAAMLKIEDQFKNDFPWLIEHINEYENLLSPEARFVKTVDKIMPKTTHVLNAGQYIKNKKVNINEWVQVCQQQADVISKTYGSEFPEIVQIFRDLVEQTRVVYLKN